jgi:hypothetical protein
MILSYLLYFILGVVEQGCAILYYKFAQKNFDGLCAIIDLIRGLIWLFIIASLIENVTQNVPLGVAYVIGGSCGDYISLKAEPYIERVVLKIKNKGRKKKRWYLQGERKD